MTVTIFLCLMSLAFAAGIGFGYALPRLPRRRMLTAPPAVPCPPRAVPCVSPVDMP